MRHGRPIYGEPEKYWEREIADAHVLLPEKVWKTLRFSELLAEVQHRQMPRLYEFGFEELFVGPALVGLREEVGRAVYTPRQPVYRVFSELRRKFEDYVAGAVVDALHQRFPRLPERL